MRAVTFALALLLALGACAPKLQPIDLIKIEPQLTPYHLIADDGAVLPIRTWLPDGPPQAVILALHGFNDYSKAFEKPAEVWQKAGIATYAYDQRGFGEAPYHGRWAGADRMTLAPRPAHLLFRPVAGHPTDGQIPRDVGITGTKIGNAIDVVACRRIA